MHTFPYFHNEQSSCSPEHTSNLDYLGYLNSHASFPFPYHGKQKYTAAIFNKKKRKKENVLVYQVDTFTHPMSRALQIVVIAWTLCLINVWEDAGARLINTYLPK